MVYTEETMPDRENAISTGSIALDTALGIGGYPKGRVIEVFGPASAGKSSMCLHAVVECQKQGGRAAFIDAEAALDVVYAVSLGVDLEELIIIQPFCGEEALNTANMLARSGEVDLIIVDSVAALVPKAELEGEMEDHSIGVQARMMSKALRMLAGTLNSANCTLIFTNQLRMKIGVMFGCFHYDTLLNFKDGRSLPIGEVVDKQIKGEVYCINADTKRIETKPITNWHDNGKVSERSDFIHIKTESIEGGGRYGFCCTPDHKILTSLGWKKASNLSYEDKLISKYKETINGSFGDFMNAILIGDSHLSPVSYNSACLRLQDNQNIEYINWKLNKLAPFFSVTKKEISRGLQYQTKYSYELAKAKRDIGTRDPMFFLERYSSLGMALWIMDDGHFDTNNGHRRYNISVKRFKGNQIKLEEITSKLKLLGFDCEYTLTDGCVHFLTKATDLLANEIASYVPSCMQYKLPEKFQGQYKDFVLSNSEVFKTQEVSIKEIREASLRQMRNKRKFDITVEGNHNYMVGGIKNGIVVHNSPEVTSGGNALAFYSSVRLRVSRTGDVGKKDDVLGNQTKVVVVKNKMAAPKKIAEFEIIFGKGINKEKDLLSEAVKDNVIQKAGSWYSYQGHKIGQGLDNVVAYFSEHPEEFIKIRQQVLEDRGLVEPLEKKEEEIEETTVEEEPSAAAEEEPTKV
ncbi:MAG: recombinase RecA [Deltaproteobacteria bacterium]|nr:MAG: recombinase RecA [Deltaproteobacteria bacterium]